MTSDTCEPDTFIPAEIEEILGPPALLSTEDEVIYYETIKRFAKDLSAKDLFTWFLIQDLVYARMEIGRCYRMKAGIVKSDYASHLKLRIELQRENTQYDIQDEVAAKATRLIETEKARASQDPEGTKKRTEEIEEWARSAAQAKRNESEALITSWRVPVPGAEEFGTAWPSWLKGHQSIDEIQTNAEKRFYASFRELERHLTGFAKTLQRELKVIEGEVVKEIRTELVKA